MRRVQTAGLLCLLGLSCAEPWPSNSLDWVERFGNRSFWILSFSDLASGAATISLQDATLLGQTTHANVYLLENRADAYNQVDRAAVVEAVRTNFDALIYPILTENFGPPPSRFDEGVTNILIGDIEQAAGDSRSVIGGFFRFADQFSDEEASSNGFGHSNEANIIYVDDTAVGSNPTDVDSIFYRTLAHEFFHLLNFRAKVEARAQDGRYLTMDESRDARERLWLDEGLAEVATDLVYGDLRTERIQFFSTVRNNCLVSEDFNTLDEFNTVTPQSAVLKGYSQSYLFTRYLTDLWGVVGGANATQPGHYAQITGEPAPLGSLTADATASAVGVANLEALIDANPLPGIDSLADLYLHWLDALAHAGQGRDSQDPSNQFAYPYLSLDGRVSVTNRLPLYDGNERQPDTLSAASFIPWRMLGLFNSDEMVLQNGQANDGIGVYIHDGGGPATPIQDRFYDTDASVMVDAPGGYAFQVNLNFDCGQSDTSHDWVVTNQFTGAPPAPDAEAEAEAEVDHEHFHPQVIGFPAATLADLPVRVVE